MISEFPHINKPRVAIITTHPIQYNAPFFQKLAERGVLEIRVFYTWGKSVLKEKYDPGFNKFISWDIPLLQGYDFEFSENIAKNPGSHNFWGIDNPTLIRNVMKWQPDAVLIYGWSFKSHFSCMRFLKGRKPVFFRGDSILLETCNKKLRTYLRFSILRYVYGFVDKVLYTGEANLKYYKKCTLNENQLIYAPHVIDNDRFAKKVNSDLRSRLSITVHETLILFSGKLDENKNVQLLINAFANINNNQIHLVIVGDGALKTKLLQLVTSLDVSISHRIHFLGFQNQSEMPGIYQACDLFVLPSKSETWGLSINEAMAASKPVIVSNTCGAAYDLVIDGSNGYVFRSNDEKSLRLTMEKAIRSKEALTEMGRNAYLTICNWTINDICIILEKSVLTTLNV